MTLAQPSLRKYLISYIFATFVHLSGAPADVPALRVPLRENRDTGKVRVARIWYVYPNTIPLSKLAHLLA